MPIHRERRLLPFRPDQVFDLVADVERYPDFLPLWQAARITRSPDDEDLYLTEQTLQLGLLRKRFRTETRLWRPSRIEVGSSDPMFDRFLIRWSFGPGEDGGCLVDFVLDCETSLPMLRPLLNLVLLEAAQGIVSAFERRAGSLFSRLP